MQSKTKIKIFIWLMVLSTLAIGANYVFSEFISIHGNWISIVYIRDIPVRAEVVQTKEKIELGLGGRGSLSAGRGMLFLMPQDSVQTFWMKGMLFPIDIIWIESGRVVGCEKNISPADKRIFSSPGEAGSILEVPAGFCEKYNIEINDEVRKE